MVQIRRNMVLDGNAYLDLAKGELRNPRIQVLSAPPAAPVQAQIYYDTALGLQVYNGTAWVSFSTYTDEQAQDAVGGALIDSATVHFTYNDAAGTITAIVVNGSVTNTVLNTMPANTVR
jgi:hypothetical protein